MTTAALRICPYNDYDDATLSVNVTLPTGFEAENTQNTARSDVLLTNDTTTLVITGVAPANRVANCFYLFRHLLNGASVRLQLFTDTGASVAATGGDSGTNAVVWWTASETYSWSDGSNDRFASESAYRYYFASDVTWRSFKLTISGTPSAVSYYQIGRIVIGKYMELGSPVAWGMELGLKDLSRAGRTDGGSRRAYRGARFRALNWEATWLTEAERGTLLQIDSEAGTAGDVVVDPFPGDTTSRGRDYLMDGFLVALNVIGRPTVNRYAKRFQLEEA